MSDCTRIGVFGGTFDPIHNAHCEIARAAQQHARLDRVLFVVAGEPPHKRGDLVASGIDRYAMVCAAVADLPGMEASSIEIDRAGPSYTVDTLRTLKRLYPEAALHLIVGYDSLIDLPKWRDVDGILACARLLAIPRPGQSTPIPEKLNGHYELLPFSETPLSSTSVRETILAGQPYAHLVPAGVARLIEEHGIYHGTR